MERFRVVTWRTWLTEHDVAHDRRDAVRGGAIQRHNAGDADRRHDGAGAAIRTDGSALREQLLPADCRITLLGDPLPG